MANSAAAVKADKPPRKAMKKSVRDTLTAYTFIAPNFIGFCVFTLVPMVFAIALAFCSWDGRHDIEFVAIDNFIKLFTTDRIFQAALVNTIVYVVGTVPLTLVCSLAMAVLLRIDTDFVSPNIVSEIPTGIVTISVNSMSCP